MREKTIAVVVSFVQDAQRRVGLAIDFVLQVGDFEPHRNEEDMKSMAAPSKYKRLGDFPSVYSEDIEFPWPVFFIGGNHEPYGFLDQHPLGFELCTNCTYLGRTLAGKIQGVNICALSGVFNEKYFQQPLPPVENIGRVSNKEYTYFRENHVEHLFAWESADVLVLHEWPIGVIAEEDQSEFERQRRSLRYSSVGNEYAWLLMEHLKPTLVVAGHMHRAFRSQLSWGQQNSLFAALAKVNHAPGAVALFQLRDELLRGIDIEHA